MSGTIKTAEGAGIAGVTVALTGPATKNATTDAQGAFTFTGLADGIYSVAPALANYVFTPLNRTIVVSGQAVTGVHFTGAVTGGGGGTGSGYDVTGTVLNENGAPLEFVLCVLQHKTQSNTMYAIYSNENGGYSFDDIANGEYELTFSYDGYEFAALNVSFAGVPLVMQPVRGAVTGGGSTYTVSGRVVDVTGAGVPGVAVTMGGDASSVTTTGSGGSYTFSGIAGGSYTLTPSLAGYSFLPVIYGVIVSGGDEVIENFVAMPVTGGGTGTMSISGAVTDHATSAGIAGVTVELRNDTTYQLIATITTDSSGTFSFVRLSAGYYAVHVERGEDFFDPHTRLVTLETASVTDLSFTGWVSGDGNGGGTGSEYDITGTVLDNNGSPLEFVLCVLENKANSLNTYVIYTNSSGAYSFDDISNGEYKLTFSYYGLTFAEQTISFNGSPVTVQAVSGAVAEEETHSVTGRVTDTFGSGVNAVTITLSGTASAVVSTNSSGNYTFDGISDGSYTITPFLPNYTFLPVDVAITVAGQDVGVETIIATPLGGGGGGGSAYYEISGTVLDNNGSPLEWTYVELKGVGISKEDFGYSNDKGAYSINYLRNGTYMLTPSYADYTFEPESVTVTIDGSNVTGVNFVATPVSSQQIGSLKVKLVNGHQYAIGTLTGESGTFSTERTYSSLHEFNDIPYGTYTLTFSLPPEFEYHNWEYFTIPESKTVVVDGWNVDAGEVEFIERMKPLYQVTGKITYSSDDKTSPNKGVFGLALQLIVAEGPYAEETSYEASTGTDGTWKVSYIDGVPNGRYRVVPQGGIYPENYDPDEIYIVVENAPVSGVNFVYRRPTQ